MHRNHFMAFLLAVSPVFCWIIAKSIDGLSRLRLSKKVVVIITIVVLLAMTTVSTYNVHSGKEILYRTYYKEMGAYVKPKIVDYEYSAFCRYMPGFTYYAGKLCIRPDFIRPHPVDQKTSDWGGLPEQKDLKEYYKDEDIRFFEFDERSIDYFLNKEQKAWVYQNCILIDQKASIPSISHHHLYDCHSDLNGGK